MDVSMSESERWARENPPWGSFFERGVAAGKAAACKIERATVEFDRSRIEQENYAASLRVLQAVEGRRVRLDIEAESLDVLMEFINNFAAEEVSC